MLREGHSIRLKRVKYVIIANIARAVPFCFSGVAAQAIPQVDA